MVRVQAQLHRLFPGLHARKPQTQPAPLQQGSTPLPQRQRGGHRSPLQGALAGLAAPLSLLPQGAAPQAEQGQEAVAPERCEVTDPSDPARATRRELSKTIDMLLWGAVVVVLCTCCPLGLLASVVLSLAGAALAVLLQVAATCQPEVLFQLASSAGGVLDVSALWSMVAHLDGHSLVLGLALACKKVLLLGADVAGLVVGMVVGVVKLVGGLFLGVAKIVKGLVLAGADVWSLLVGGGVGLTKGTRAARAALGRRKRDGEADGGEADGSEDGAGGADAPSGTPSVAPSPA